MALKIGNTTLKLGLMLAPMAGYTDRAMRLISREMGAEYLVTEMVSAKAVVYKDKKTHLLARIREGEEPTALQLFGKEPGIMAEAAGIMEKGEEGCLPPAAIDINMGCPVNKIFSNGEGSALMRSPALIHDIVRAVRGATALPVTVKLRAGVDPENINAVECAIAAEEGGASLVCVHGRTRVAMYSGSVDYEVIRKVKESLHIPVVANGDITDGASAKRVLSTTGADGLMIGRAAVGSPFIFREIFASLSGFEYTGPTLSERVDVALRQIRYAIEDKGEEIACRESRKAIALYLSDFRGAARARAEINRALTYSDIETALMEALRQNSEG